jgi:hypothetical protein
MNISNVNNYEIKKFAGVALENLKSSEPATLTGVLFYRPLGPEK